MVFTKANLEFQLHDEKKQISDGRLKEDSPLDVSPPFRSLCEAARKGDLKVCQECITDGVNINARDSYDYTPLILVSAGLRLDGSMVNDTDSSLRRPAFVVNMKSYSFCWKLGRYVNEIPFKVKGGSALRLTHAPNS